ncbi:N-acetylmuramoyl-L-alanine amidase [Thiomicrorhabdus sp. Kp2]|uniref:N-acetylmuramoyl-L-alanine amidase n=1 Tax=Thiomicrorhabdus sp. Kp2 TaxID=1123518 RepID=UPI0003FAA7F8|nr:N-acetylmuramoyl-L-alanine amidase [Thiomicrorhabdus sp. Kp2]
MKSLELTKKTISLVLGAFLFLWMQNAVAGGVLSSMRIGQTSDKTRVVFDLKDTQTYKVSELTNPSRLVVDFYNTANYLSFKNKHITDSRLFKIRVSKNSKRVRVVLDLHKTPEYKAFLLDENSKKARLVVDLTDKKIITKTNKSLAKATKNNVKPALSKNTVLSKSKSEALDNTKTKVTQQAVLTAHSASSTSIKKEVNTPPKITAPLVKMASVDNNQKMIKATKPSVNKKTESLLNKESAVFAKSHEFVVAIDAGHGGKDTGAIGHNRIYEKDATLTMAKELKKIIDRQPGMHAVLTRDKDVFIPLSKRVQIAKQKNADLFISIHADAFHDHSVRGGSVYILSERGASSTMAKLLARSENASLQDVSLNGLDDDVAFALSDLSRDANIKASRKLAVTVLKEMQKTVKMHKHSVQSAGFAVLKSIDMPSLLIETAFISNPHEARNLMSKKFQLKMANAIADGLNKYVDQYGKKPSWGETLYVQYKVQKGDTLSQIAANYEVSTKTLKKLNGIKNANSLYVGKKLKIPVSEKLLAGI